VIQQAAIAFLALSFALQVIALALALRLAFSRRTLRQLPAWWAWALTAAGLIVMLVRWGLTLPKAFSEAHIADSLVTIFTSTFLTVSVIALFRRLTSAEATSRRRCEELTAVQRVGAASTSTLTLDQVLRQIYEQVRQLIPLNAFCLALYDKVTDDLRMELIVEEGQGQPPFTIKATDSTGLTARVIRSRQPLRINDLEAHKELHVTIPQQASQATIHSWLGLPLMVQDHVVGALSVQSYQANAFTAEHERLLATIAAQAAIAIENARLSQDLRAVRECYRTLIENSKDAILIETEDDEILDANPQACQLLGYGLDELLRLRVPDLQAPEVRGQAGSVVKSELARSGRVFESLHLHHDGRRIPVEISITRIGRANKGLAFVILRDMTERKRAEEILRQTTAG